jgi:hypothetical protein
MRKFHSIAALCGDGLRPELQALFDRLAVDPHSELFVRGDGMVQSGPDPVSEATKTAPATTPIKNWLNSVSTRETRTTPARRLIRPPHAERP